MVGESVCGESLDFLSFSPYGHCIVPTTVIIFNQIIAFKCIQIKKGIPSKLQGPPFCSIAHLKE